MSSEQTSFLYSANAGFINDLYSRYAHDPHSVDPTWKIFFDDLKDDAALLRLRNSNGISAPRQEERGRQSDQASPSNENPTVSAEEQRKAAMDSLRAAMLIRVYRVRGHLMTHLDPLNIIQPQPHPELDPANYGFEERDYDRPIFIDGMLGLQHATLREILPILHSTYCHHIGVEFMHIQDPDQKSWIQHKLEEARSTPSYPTSTKRQILERLTAGDGFERFLATKFVGVKRFGLEGGEAMIPALETVITKATTLGLDEAVIGMAHRGRLNVLTNIMGKSFTALFSEFQGVSPNPDTVQGSGDVKYHLGFSGDRVFQGKTVHLTLNPNPSHLEWVNPVVVGRVRAKQQQRAQRSKLVDADFERVMGILIHGDAAMAGQGIVAETMMMSDLSGYRTGGTIHFVINNQVGFTTRPQYSRSGIYCTDIAKMIQAPIFHVNGDDVEAVCFVSELASEFRQKFHKDVVIDMVCYRRHGHNEGDEPAFTLPLMYKKIKTQPTTRDVYVNKLTSQSTLTQADADSMNAEFMQRLEKDFEASASYRPNKANWLEGRWQGLEVANESNRAGDTSTPLARLKEIGRILAKVPENFTINPKIAKQLEARLAMTESGEGIDWATGEALAFGSLLLEGSPVRLSGQDCGRGTFSHRHAMLYDQNDEHRYVPLNNLSKDQAHFEVHDSPLSEAAVMGFDYGFTLAEPNSLVCWEGQFGDFANTAQVIIDQFISSAESKWLRLSGLTLLLPHGQEGQGPEHSSARLERYLQLCAEENMQVANCTTPANYYHILRRQMRRKTRKPLIIMTPKSLLRHKLCVSKLSEMAEGSSFRRVIGETNSRVDEKKVRRVLITSGKVYYDLWQKREDLKITDVAIIRIEEYYPFPDMELAKELKRYPKAEVLWVQEEPENNGAWTFLDRRIEQVLRSVNHKSERPTYCGRPASASPAAGSLKRFTKEQEELLMAALKT